MTMPYCDNAQLTMLNHLIVDTSTGDNAIDGSITNNEREEHGEQLSTSAPWWQFESMGKNIRTEYMTEQYYFTTTTHFRLVFFLIPCEIKFGFHDNHDSIATVNKTTSFKIVHKIRMNRSHNSAAGIRRRPSTATSHTSANAEENFIIRPHFERKFRAPLVKSMMQEVMAGVLGDKEYIADQVPLWTAEICKEVQTRLQNGEKFKMTLWHVDRWTIRQIQIRSASGGWRAEGCGNSVLLINVLND